MINKVKIYIICTTIIVLLCSLTLNNIRDSIDDFIYKKVPSEIIQVYDLKVNLTQYTNVSDYFPKGYSKKGDEDYTKYIQKAIYENNNVILPDFPVLVNDSGIQLKSNLNIYFQKNTKLLLSASNKQQYGILNLESIQNVNIYNPTIIGDRNKHIGNKGEWGMGVRIVGSKNIKIINPNIINCWGDGIYIGGKTAISSSQITIKGGIVDNNRRNGISIVDGESIKIQNIVLANTNGTLPMAGIDLEPNKNEDKLTNILLQNVISYNNMKDGYLVYLGSFLGNKEKEININLENCKNYFSENAISIPGLRNDYKKDIKKHKGKIMIKNFVSYDSKEIFKKSSGNYQYTPYIDIINIQQYTKGHLDEKNEQSFKEWFTKRSLKNKVIK